VRADKHDNWGIEHAARVQLLQAPLLSIEVLDATYPVW
jgi:hypothetical protein